MTFDRDLVLRPAGIEDRSAILGLAQRSLGWVGDERDRAFFSWKHDDNPFGPSPMWVAEVEGALLGFRTFLRWELLSGREVLRCVRAVDTATHPAAQGRGIFRALTLHAVGELTTSGAAAVFNTPNEQSRPGYLKMGWHDLGRATLHVVPRAPRSLLAMARSRVGAEKWSLPVDVGEPASAVLRSVGAEILSEASAPAAPLRTRRSLEHLRWRYGFEPLCYRALEVRGGWCIFRVRRRGRGRELAVCEWLSEQPDLRALRRLVKAVQADYAVGLGMAVRRHGAIPVPRSGPHVTWRPLAREGVPGLRDLALALGDLELF